MPHTLHQMMSPIGHLEGLHAGKAMEAIAPEVRALRPTRAITRGIRAGIPDVEAMLGYGGIGALGLPAMGAALGVPGVGTALGIPGIGTAGYGGLGLAGVGYSGMY